MTHITFMDRVKAAKVVEALRQYYMRDKVAEILGICPIYVSTIQHKQLANRHCPYGDVCYAAPKHAIRKVLDYLKIIDGVIE